MNHSRVLQTLAFLVLCYLPAPLSRAIADDDNSYDVVIYGGTAAGIVAAVQVKRMGGSVVVVEPRRTIGGLTTGGLGQTDIGNKAAIGGIAREFYQRVRKHYQQPESWKWQRREEYRDSGQSRTGSNEEAMWTFEPSAALSIMQGLVREFDIPVMHGQRLDRTSGPNSSSRVRGVTLAGKRIMAIKTECGHTYRGRIFIDATYEGDLLAGAGVSYTVGREGNRVYGETLNGVQTRHAKFHQFVPGVDPYVVPGDASSGLLPGIDADGPGEEGSGDRRVQAFCFRMCLTDHPNNRIPFAKPAGYDPLVYELLLRNFEAGENGMPWINSSMPNRKTDTNNRTAFSTDFIGHNYDYPEASYAERETIRQRHREYQQGLMWTLANHPRVPDHIRHEVARWGMCRDEFEREVGWQQQLYVREARRMIGAAVMTQHHCQRRQVAEDAIGLAAYTMDSHNVQRYVDANGQVRNEGDVEVGGFPPYAISYGSLTPKPEHCENLLVPVCLSASHIAFGSIRMEPVFMVLGQSAATAAMQAIEADVPVQAVSYDTLKQKLLADGQVLAWTGPVFAPAATHAAERPPQGVAAGVEKPLLIAPRPENGRNSEGDFIQLKDGRLLLVYSKFIGTGDHAPAELVGRYSSDGGRTWGRDDLQVIARKPGEANLMSVSLLRLQNDRIAIFYVQKYSSPPDSKYPYLDYILMRTSADEGLTWSEPMYVVPKDEQGYRVLNNDRVVQLKTGRLVVPLAVHYLPGWPNWRNSARILCYLSDDQGKTWRPGKSTLQSELLAQEPGVVELKDDGLLMFCRSRDCQLVSRSDDGGDTWSPLKRSKISQPTASPASIERIPATGHLLLVWNNGDDPLAAAQPVGRRPFTAAISKDEGATWRHIQNLGTDPQGWYCYTAIEFVGDHVLLAHCEYPGLNSLQVTRLPVSWLYESTEAANAKQTSR